MATIVNARDVRLQLTPAASRVASVQMASNIVVSQDNVTGLGLVVAGTKMVFLSASAQVFQIAKTGVVSPTSTVLSAELKNLTGTPTLTVVSGTITPTPTLVGGAVTISNTALMTDAATIRLTVVEGGVTYTDEVTIVKVREGTDALVGFLTNESHTVAADYLGNVTNYGGAGGTFKVFSGTADITNLCTFAIQAGGNPAGLTFALGATTGVYSVNTGMLSSTEVTTVTMTATFGAAVLVKVFTLSKVRLPALARFIDLQASSQVFQVLKNGTVNPPNITFTSSSNGLAGTPVFTVSPGTATIASTPGSNVCNITYANMGVNETVTVTATQDGMSDVITVVKVREGADAIDYDLTVESDKGTIFKIGQSLQMVLKARVFKNGVEVTADLPASRFSWRRSSYYPRQAPNDDASWNAQFSTGYKQITITTDAVEHRATFMCDLLDQ